MADRRLSEDAQTILDSGMTSAQIARLFKMDGNTVRARIANTKHIGTREGAKVYSVKQVAAQLVPPPDNLVAQVMRLNHMDLPPMLRKEYWTGEAQRLKVLELQGELWRTEKVLEYVGLAFKEIRMQIMLASDTVERKTEFTDRQRETLKAIHDGLLESLRVKLIETFTDKRTEAKPDEQRERPALTVAELVADL